MTENRKMEDQVKTMYSFVEVEKDCFRADYIFHARQSPAGQAYGGLILSQALAAADKTVPGAFKPNSMHSYFISAVISSKPVNYHVRRIKDGRAFVTRKVEAVQDGNTCFILQVSFHKPEKESMIHQDIMPKVVSPDHLISMREAVILTKKLVEQGGLTLKPAMINRLMVLDRKAFVTNDDIFETRCTNLGNWYGYSSDLKPEHSFWMRTKISLGDDERVHRYLLACMSDSILIPAAMSAQDGELIASCQQEAIVRGKDGELSKI